MLPFFGDYMHGGVRKCDSEFGAAETTRVMSITISSMYLVEVAG